MPRRTERRLGWAIAGAAVVFVAAFGTTFWSIYRFGLPPVWRGRAGSDDRLNAALTSAATVGGAVAVLAGVVITLRREPAPKPAPESAAGLSGLTSPAIPSAAGAGPRPEPVVFGEIPREPMGYQTRADLDHELAAALDGAGRAVCALIGSRGVGKTQIAGAYARTCVEQGWPLVAWIPVEQPASVVAGLAALADALGLRTRGEDAETAAGAARSWLERSPEPTLVVFDSATDPDSLADWLPRTGRCRVVITTARQAFSAVGKAVQVGVFTPEEAVTFLLERTGRTDRRGAEDVARELGWLALALAQAARVIEAQGLGFADYMTKVRTVPVATLLKPVSGERYPQSLAEAVLLSLDEAEQDGAGEATRRLAEVLAVLSPAGVSRALLPAAMDAHPGGTAPAEVDEALGHLTEASLASFGLDDDVVVMHLLVQHVVRSRARRDDRAVGVVTAVLDALDASRFPPHDAWGRRESGQHLVKQISALWKVLPEMLLADHPGTEPGTEPGTAPGIDAGTDAGEAPAAHLVGRMLNLRDWAMRALIGMADLEHATSAGRELVADRTRILGADHPDTLASRNGLAEALVESGRLLEAIAVLEEVAADRARVLGGDHPDTLASRHDLARVYRKAGRLVGAIRLNETVVAERSRVLGPDHPDTLQSRNTLAYAYRVAGRTAEAIELFEAVAADRLRVLGRDHPQTLRSRHDLAYAYRLTGRLEDAIALYKAVVRDRTLTLGLDHPDTLRSRNNLAGAYRAAGQLDEATALVEKVVDDRVRLLGPRHPHTLISQNVLGRVYRKSGRLTEAIGLYETLVADRVDVLGPDHPDTLTSRDALAFAHTLAGHSAVAIGQFQAVVADRERILGPDHPDTLTSRDALAYAYRLAGELPVAIERFEAVVADRLRVLGYDHPDALSSRQHLAAAYRVAGAPEKAVGLLVGLVADTTRVLGPDHPHTLSARQHVARAFLTVGRVPEAVELFETVVADRLRVLCHDHPDTLSSRHHLASAYLAAGWRAEAAALFAVVKADCLRVLGPNHPYTLATADGLRQADRRWRRRSVR